MSELNIKHSFWAEEDDVAAESAIKAVQDNGLKTLRLSFPDQHGILRGKVIPAQNFLQALRNGCGMPTSLLLKDTSHKTVFPIWQQDAGVGNGEFTGAGDFIMVPDPKTFKILSWGPKTAAG